MLSILSSSVLASDENTMIAVNLDRVTVTYVSQPIFEDLSWEIHDGAAWGWSARMAAARAPCCGSLLAS